MASTRTPQRFFARHAQRLWTGLRKPQEPARSGAALAVWSGSRALLWGLLTVGLLGTAASANTLPYPFSLLLLMPSMVGGLCAFLVMVVRLHIACVAAVNVAGHRARALRRGHQHPTR